MSKKKATPTLERLQELFHYDPEEGSLIRKVKVCNAVKIGDVAGYRKFDGFASYWIAKVDGKAYPVHALVWKMAYGEDPAEGFDIHHGTGGPLDNRLENLQLLTHRQNTSQEKTETSGLPVGVRRSRKRYATEIMISGKRISAGSYDTPEAASEAYQKALAMYLDGSTPQEIRQALGVAQFSSKYKGVCWHKQNQKWVAQITIDGKNKYLGLFPTEEAAHQAYLQHKN